MYLLHQERLCQGRSICPLVGLSQTWSGTGPHHSASHLESGLNSCNSCPRCIWKTGSNYHYLFLTYVNFHNYYFIYKLYISSTVCAHGMTGWSGSGQCGGWTPCDPLQTHGTTWLASHWGLWHMWRKLLWWWWQTQVQGQQINSRYLDKNKKLNS